MSDRLSRRRLLGGHLALLALLLAQATAGTSAPVVGPRLVASVSSPTWVAPLPVLLVHAFERPVSRYAAGHRGVDLAAAPGAQVRAAGSGTVVYAGLLAGRPVVSVEHPDGLRTTYEPVDPTVRRGQRVAVGELLGTLGPVHRGCGTCLHWGLLRSGNDGTEYLDPFALLRRGPSRLLPLDAYLAR